MHIVRTTTSLPPSLPHRETPPLPPPFPPPLLLPLLPHTHHHHHHHSRHFAPNWLLLPSSVWGTAEEHVDAGWFRRTYFAYHGQVRLRFKLAAGLGEPWCRDGGIPQGCPLSMVFVVALYVPWCRHLDALPDVEPQLYADNLKCSAERPRALFESARFTAQYVRSVGHDVSPGKCVFLSTSKSVRQAMKLWDVSGSAGFWKVQLDVRDLGGHLDFTLRAPTGFVKLLLGARHTQKHTQTQTHTQTHRHTHKMDLNNILSLFPQVGKSEVGMKILSNPKIEHPEPCLSAN